MIDNRISRALKLWPLLLFACAATPAHALQIVTEENPPFNFTEGGKLKGMSTQIVAALGVRTDTPMNFKAMAWPNAYEIAQSKRDACVYSTVRLENRERIFKWVGPIASDSWGLYAKSAFGAEIKTLADVRPFRIGAVTDDAKVEWLKQRAVTNIDMVDDDRKNPPRLTLDRKQQGGIDLWVASVYHAREVAAAAKVSDLKLVLKINEQQLWLACNPGVSSTVIKAMQDALDAMRKDGTYDKIVQPYMKQFAQ